MIKALVMELASNTIGSLMGLTHNLSKDNQGVFLNNPIDKLTLTVTLIQIAKAPKDQDSLPKDTEMMIFSLVAQEYDAVFVRRGSHWQSEEWWNQQETKTAVIRLG